MLGLVLFGVENFDARYFFGCEITGSCIFLGSQYEAPLDPPPSCILRLPPPGAVTHVTQNTRLCRQRQLFLVAPKKQST